MAREIRGFLVAACLLAAAAGANAQQMFKCGATYQDRPCAERDVQSRYAPSVGRFEVEQANPDTDRDCARVVSEVMPYWSRLHGGESLEALRAEYDAKPVARAEKSRMRDLLIAMRQIGGNATQARSQLETQCMAYKRRRGMPTDRDMENARSATATGTVSAWPNRGANYEAQRRAAQEAAEERRAGIEAQRRLLQDQQRIRELCWQKYRQVNC